MCVPLLQLLITCILVRSLLPPPCQQVAASSWRCNISKTRYEGHGTGGQSTGTPLSCLSSKNIDTSNCVRHQSGKCSPVMFFEILHTSRAFCYTPPSCTGHLLQAHKGAGYVQMGHVVMSLLLRLRASAYSNSVLAQLDGSAQVIPKPVM